MTIPYFMLGSILYLSHVRDKNEKFNVAALEQTFLRIDGLQVHLTHD